ncbi:MAG: VOC family protein [Firmicutes bacterium]|nr:VOC family protein [Bacillota bacterium]
MLSSKSMTFGGICITTSDAPRLAEFYKILLQEEPFVEGSHYAFGKIAVWDPGDVKMATEKNIWLQFFDSNIDELYERLLREIPGIRIVSPPERKPWGAYSFWLLDPDGNKIAVAEISK